ncbi:hypothetical protein [Pseudochrobactrum kiredjianiae]|uniref:Uncharacterized protein n=1 Tax=Pseudochrobactrum kiredjianiae TaxID=386305 RepID=A0ABW3V2Y0_9HYPH|nr:hypothetical protein [Pseudochrobactrum kiredjianiae]MDM7851640.1 hypothetical protein [Pseudochrobactrum kiredjianiae]
MLEYTGLYDCFAENPGFTTHGYSEQFIRIKHFQTVFNCSTAFKRVRLNAAIECFPDVSGNKIANAPATIFEVARLSPPPEFS